MRPDHFMRHLLEKDGVKALKVSKLTYFVPKVRDTVPEV